MRAKDLRDKDEPKCESANTDRDAPKRAKLLSASEDPRLVISITDRENRDPNRATPKTDRVEPRRATLRSESDIPRCEPSNTEGDEPR